MTNCEESRFMSIHNFFNHIRFTDVFMIDGDLVTKEMYDTIGSEKVIFVKDDKNFLMITPLMIESVEIFPNDLIMRLKDVSNNYHFKFYNQDSFKGNNEVKVLDHVITSQRISSHDYLYIGLDKGNIQIKLDDEGVVVDIMDSNEESIATTYAFYSEM